MRKFLSSLLPFCIVQDRYKVYLSSHKKLFCTVSINNFTAKFWIGRNGMRIIGPQSINNSHNAFFSKTFHRPSFHACMQVLDNDYFCTLNLALWSWRVVNNNTRLSKQSEIAFTHHITYLRHHMLKHKVKLLPLHIIQHTLEIIA